jgi:hypothetical protein
MGLKGLPMVEPMLISLLELLRTKAGGDDLQRVCFDVRQGNRQSNVGHHRCPSQADSSLFIFIAPSTSFRFARQGRAAARVASTPVAIVAGEALRNGDGCGPDEYAARTDGALDAINSHQLSFYEQFRCGQVRLTPTQ